MGKQSLRILAIHRYYWPDTPPYALMLKVIAERWAESGHDVEVLSSQPSYKPELEIAKLPSRRDEAGVRVRRIAMRSDRGPLARRLWNVARFSLIVFARILVGRRRDVVMCSTAPPVVLAALASLAARARGSAFVYHCMDIHPEIGGLSGEFRNRRVFGLLQRMDLATCRRSSTIVVLSDDMADALCRRDPALRSRVRIINNFDLPATAESMVSALPRRPDTVRVVFTGNLGRFQNLEKVVEAVLADDERLDRLELVLMGEGAAKSGLIELVSNHPDRSQRVVLLPHGPVEAARALMADADLGLVALAPGVIDFAYPSKTASYLSEGLPVLAAVESGSALVRELTAWQVGASVDVGSVDALSDQLASWTTRVADLAEMRARARQIWEKEFSVENKLPQWDRLVESTARGQAR